MRGGNTVNVNRLPKLLEVWLESRAFHWGRIDKDHPRCLNEDEIYSAAVECLGDCYQYGNLWSEESASDKAVLRRFVEREGKTHTLLPLSVWYHKGA